MNKSRSGGEAENGRFANGGGRSEIGRGGVREGGNKRMKSQGG